MYIPIISNWFAAPKTSQKTPSLPILEEASPANNNFQENLSTNNENNILNTQDSHVASDIIVKNDIGINTDDISIKDENFVNNNEEKFMVLSENFLDYVNNKYVERNIDDIKIDNINEISKLTNPINAIINEWKEIHKDEIQPGMEFKTMNKQVSFNKGIINYSFEISSTYKIDNRNIIYPDCYAISGTTNYSPGGLSFSI